MSVGVADQFGTRFSYSCLYYFCDDVRLQVPENESVPKVPWGGSTTHLSRMFSWRLRNSLDVFVLVSHGIGVCVSFERMMDFISDILWHRSSKLLLFMRGYRCIVSTHDSVLF